MKFREPTQRGFQGNDNSTTHMTAKAYPGTREVARQRRLQHRLLESYSHTSLPDMYTLLVGAPKVVQQAAG